MPVFIFLYLKIYATYHSPSCRRHSLRLVELLRTNLFTGESAKAMGITNQFLTKFRHHLYPAAFHQKAILALDSRSEIML
jgi:hypothetical protein